MYIRIVDVKKNYSINDKYLSFQQWENQIPVSIYSGYSCFISNNAKSFGFVFARKPIFMTGLHDHDRMKSGKALLAEYIADASAVCNVSFFDVSKIPGRTSENHEFAFAFKENLIGYWNYFGTGKYFC